MNGDNQMNQFPIADKPARGPVFGIVIIVLLIIIGGIYILSSRSEEQPPADTTTVPAVPAPTDSPAGREESDLSDLEDEIKALETDLQTLEQEAAQ